MNLAIDLILIIVALIIPTIDIKKAKRMIIDIMAILSFFDIKISLR